MPAQLAKYLPCEVESLCSILAGVTLRASRICGRKICLYFENNISNFENNISKQYFVFRKQYFEIQQICFFGSDNIENDC